MQAIDHVILFTKSDCYKANRKMTPKGIVVHSTGANNPNLKRYVQPDNGEIGVNPNGNDLNRSGQDVCVHAFIGKDESGMVKCVRTLPFDICAWGVGNGSKGSYNYDPAYIQFEICEDGLTDKAYCKSCYDKAVELCVILCKTYNIDVNNIVSHKEAHDKGYASNHGDPHHWWKKHGLTMDGFRKAVKEKIGKSADTSNATKTEAENLYKVRKSWNDAKSQIGAYASLDNAKKACKAGCTVYDSNGKAVYSVKDTALKVGDKVKVNYGAKDVNGVQLASFVYATVYTVLQMDGNRIVIGLGKTVTAAVNKANLTKV